MAHFAELDGDGVVQRVVVFDGHGEVGEVQCAAFMAEADTAALIAQAQADYAAALEAWREGDEEGEPPVYTEPEPVEEGTWKQTSYTGAIRTRFAGIGFTYDAEADAFVAPPVIDPEETD